MGAYGWKSVGWLWSRALLTAPFFLVLLIGINFGGTIYGYMWYGDQLEATLQAMPDWYLPFVPDSPTASLFFSISLVFLWLDGKGFKSGTSSLWKQGRGLIEAFGVIASVKYGVWAVGMIVAGGLQGDSIDWQEWMLIGSHLGMAAEAVLYARLFCFRPLHVGFVGAWMIWNDVMDYHRGVYPWLPNVLDDDLPSIERFTNLLSILCVLMALWLYRNFIRGRGRQA